MNVQNRLLLLLNVAMFGLFVWAFIAQGTPLLRPGDGWEYKDLVAILLSVVSIVVTFVGIIVAVAAIWGYQSIKGVAEQKAEETSKAGCDEYLKSEPFKMSIASAIREQIENEVRSALQTELGAGILGTSADPLLAAGPKSARPHHGRDLVEGDKVGADEPWQD